MFIILPSLLKYAFSGVLVTFFIEPDTISSFSNRSFQIVPLRKSRKLNTHPKKWRHLLCMVDGSPAKLKSMFVLTHNYFSIRAIWKVYRFFNDTLIDLQGPCIQPFSQVIFSNEPSEKLTVLCPQGYLSLSISPSQLASLERKYTFFFSLDVRWISYNSLTDFEFAFFSPLLQPG